MAPIPLVQATPPYQAGYADECYLVRRRVLTRYGWRWRSVQICN